MPIGFGHDSEKYRHLNHLSHLRCRARRLGNLLYTTGFPKVQIGQFPNFYNIINSPNYHGLSE